MSTEFGKIHLPLVPTEDVNTLNIRVYHSKGGLSYSDYKRYEGGIRLNIHAVKREPSSGGMLVESFMMFGGQNIAIMLEPGERLNRKRGLKVFEDCRQEIENRSGMTWEKVAEFLEKTGLALA